jgi:hypothetical protein
MISSSPLPVTLGGTAASADVVAAGLPIPPIERIRIFSDGQWEDFVLEWADSLRDHYGTVEQCGGAGDMGRDIIAFDTVNPLIWDNYQCKHYKSGLAPGDIWVELGKLVYYTHNNEYTYRRAIELQGRVSELQSLSASLGLSVPGNNVELGSARVRSDEAEAFSQEVESLLRSWHFPGLDRVTFSEGDQDIVISGRARASHGKGVRAIAHAAFNLALLRFCLKEEMPHPGFVLIDSPLVVYREPDTDEGGFSHDVKDAFYWSIAEDFHASQVIIFENEDPPSELSGDANIIRFTGTSHGRQGFIPRSV